MVLSGRFFKRKSLCAAKCDLSMLSVSAKCHQVPSGWRKDPLKLTWGDNSLSESSQVDIFQSYWLFSTKVTLFFYCPSTAALPGNTKRDLVQRWNCMKSWNHDYSEQSYHDLSVLLKCAETFLKVPIQRLINSPILHWKLQIE